MIKHNIKSISLPSDKEVNRNFSATIEFNGGIKEWVKAAKKGIVFCKGRTLASGLREFKKLNNVKEFYMQYKNQTANYKDDVLDIHYTTK